MCPWGEKGRAPHSASCTASAPACPSSPGSGPRPWLQCLHAAWRQFSPPTPFLVSMAIPVEITLKRNETSSFSVWQVGGGELSWEKLGKGFEEVWRERTVGCIPTWGPSAGGSRAGGMWGHTPTVALGVGSPRWYGASLLHWESSTLTWWDGTRVLLLPLWGGCQVHEDQARAPHQPSSP